ncbi:hypothetical protein EW146_g175 [Bondarzewia mesenterica]|uniref:Conserved oligomeric Golgi complex subunit 5 n=1 Tax=Bondarzewia mesenterica TaxID=1095465 RepID=A0A4S4M7Q4_9AGAM|nr:hypothetical protein EW146_g175 [Bondarzewia mesenterica]
MTDYSIFASPDFDANEYANAILAGEPYPPQAGAVKAAKPSVLEPAKEDISVAIAKLNYGIDDVEKQIKNVCKLQVLATSKGPCAVFALVWTSLTFLWESYDQKIRDPYQALQTNVTRLQRLQQVSDALRRTSRFVMLAKRLQSQMVDLGDGFDSAKETMSKPEVKVSGPSVDSGRRSGTPGLEFEGEKERTLAQAALSVTELYDLLDDPQNALPPAPSAAPPNEEPAPHNRRISLREVRAVAVHIPFIDTARAKVTGEMETMVLTGLADINQSLLASSLQAAYNLRVLPELVQNLVADLSDAVETRIRSAFDISRISKDLISKDSAPSSQLLSYKSRVYTLEKVLKLKKNPVSQVVFLDEAMKLLENKPSSMFWSALGQSLEKQSRDGAKNSTFLQQTLSTGYPRLLRLFHDFFSKIAVYTDTVYTSTQQSPETTLVLHALSTFEMLYLSRVSNRLNESVGQAFQGGARSPPGTTEGINISRTVANELDSAKFDPLLVRSVAYSVKTSLEMMMSRVDGLVVRDRSALTLLGPMATPSQMSNASLATCLYHCSSRLQKLAEEYSESVYEIIRPPVKDMSDSFERIIDPLLGVIKRELSAIIAKLHRIDFAKEVDPMSGGMGGSSPYVKELAEKLTFIKAEILGRTTSIVTHVIKTFVLHVSIAKPLNESGKLQLTSDMTELEFALSAFMLENPQGKRGGNLEVIGDDYRALRAMRPLLFLDNRSLASPQLTAGLPPLIVLHHILVRSPVSLPHQLHGWQESEYVRWVEEHSEEEALTLIDSGLSHWEKITESEGNDPSAAIEYVQLARTVLANSRSY